MKIGTYIKQQRKFKKLTIEKLAELSGVSKSALSRIERNETTTFDPISRALTALGLSVEDANRAGVNWWSDEPETASVSDDMQYIIDWLNAQPAELVKEFRLLLEHIEELRRENR